MIRILCYYLFLRTTEYSLQFTITEDCKRYFKMMGFVIYTAYIEVFLNAIYADPNNTKKVTLIANTPKPRQKPLYFCKNLFKTLGYFSNFFS